MNRNSNGENETKSRRFSDIFDTGYLRTVFFGALAAVLVVGLFYYVSWHLTGGFEGEIETAPALVSSAEVSYEAVGYFFRDEAPLYSKYGGAVDYAFPDGEKVAAGDKLLVAYENADSAYITAKLKETDERIRLLERSKVGDHVSVSFAKALENSIKITLTSLRASLAEGDYGSAVSKSNELLILLNKKDLIFSSQSGFDSLIAELKAQRNELARSLSGEYESVYAVTSGYFYSNSDGLESAFSAKALEDITPSGLDAIKQTLPQKSGNAVGKLASSRKWYLVIETDSSELKHFTAGSLSEVEFADSGNTVLSMLLEKTVIEGERALLVLSSERLPEQLDMVRKHNVSVKIKEYRGLRIPVSAIRYIDGYEGVFATFGNTVLFRVVDVVGIVDGYAYVSENTQPVTVSVQHTDAEGNITESEEILYGALGLYDNVVISGVGLHHGMIIE